MAGYRRFPFCRHQSTWRTPRFYKQRIFVVDLYISAELLSLVYDLLLKIPK